MSKNWRHTFIFLAFFLAGLSGCRRDAGTTEQEDVAHLNEATDIDLKSLLDQSRSELADEVQKSYDAASNSRNWSATRATVRLCCRTCGPWS